MGRIAREAGSPQSVRENNLAPVTRLVLFRQEIAAYRWLHAERSEKIERHTESGKPRRLSRPHQRKIRELEQRDVLARAAVGSPLMKVAGVKRKIPRHLSASGGQRSGKGQ